MSNVLEEAALEAVRTQQRNDNQNEATKKFQTTFNLSESITQVMKFMHDESKDEERHIPQKLYEFVKDPKYEGFLQTLLEYCKELFRLENKQQVLEQEAKQRGLPVPQVLPSEKKKLNEKATKMANAYSWVIFKNASLSEKAFKANKSFIQFKSKIEANKRPDINFFETLTIFSAKVLKDAFDSSELMKLEEEINRLFRTNAFNITERKLHKDALEKQYPQLKDIPMPSSSNELSQQIQMTLIQRQKVPKDARRMKFQRNKSEIRPFYQKLNTSSALNSRSPMVSLIFPSLKDKIKMFEEESKKKESQRAGTSVFVKRRELEKMVETETRKRNQSFWKI